MGASSLSGTPRVVVIGSGMGGSAAALLLADAGCRVTLVEKNRRVGGSCSAYDKQGFHIDVGTHLFCRGDRGPLGDVLRRVGEGGAIEFRQTRDLAELRFPLREGDRPRGVTIEGGVVRLPIPSELHRLPAFAWNAVRALRLTPLEAAKAARLFTHILTMTDEEVEAWDGRTLEDFITPYIDHPPTIALFGFLLGLYFVIPYWEASAGEALWSFRRMVLDHSLSYPRGGSIAIPGTYCKFAAERGADVRLGTGVKRIVVERGRASGVELEDGTRLDADSVVSTSSLKTTVFRLVGADRFPAAYAERAAAVVQSFIAVQAKIGLKKKLVTAGALVGGVGGPNVDLLNVPIDEMKDMFRSATRGSIPSVVPFYCPVPTNFDPSLAPPGHQLLTVCALAPTSDVALRDPPAAWEEAMLETLRRVVPGLDDHALFVDRFSVEFIEKWIGKEFGPAISTAQTPGQVGALRPSVRSPLPGLYLAGCGAGARGVGTELAAASGMECADAILEDSGRAVPRRKEGHRDVKKTALNALLAPAAWATRVTDAAGHRPG